MNETIRVGVVGASPDRGWAPRSHLPAIAALPGFSLTAVATTRPDSAEEAARRFGAAYAFTDAAELAAHPDVDLVAVCVKAPDHDAVVRTALTAHKHLYCEWPLGTDLTQATELAALADAAEVHQAIGLQGRMSPAVNYLRDLLGAGELGEVLSVSFVQYGSRGGREVHLADRWEADRTNGATLLSVTAAHSFDLLRHCLGELAELRATLAVRNPVARVIETGEELPVSSPDVILLQGRFATGAYLSANVQGGLPGARGSRLEVRGSGGRLLLKADSNFQMSDDTLRLSRAAAGGEPAQLVVPPEYRRAPEEVPPGNARNVAAVYLALAEAIAGRESDCPDFSDALALHGLVAAIERSAQSGERVAG